MQGNIEKARALGYSETILGRRRYLPEITSDNRQVREAAERTALNTPIQGSAADIIKIAMVSIQAALSSKFPNARMILQVHDELVFEAPKTEAEALRDMVVDMMSNAYKLDVPLKVDAGIGENWSQAH
jgi:DNA polymerase-1